MTKLARQWNSLHSKLLRIILISFVVGMTFAGSIIFFVGNNITRSNMMDGLSVTGKIIADRSAAALIFFDAASAEDNLRSAYNSRNIDYLCLYDASGKLFSVYANEGVTHSCQENVSPVVATAVVQKEKAITLAIPVIDRDDLLGHLHVSANTHALVQAQWMLAVVLIICLLVSLVVAYLLGSRLVRRSLLPLDELFETSTIIAKNPLSPERAKKISDDELGRVVDVFNTMLDNLARENRALVFSENRFRTLAENAPIGVFLKNEYGEYEYANSRWYEITGLDEVSSRSFYSFVNGADRKYYREALDATHKSHQTQVIEYKYAHPDRGERNLMEYISPVLDESERRLYIGSLLDVTELKLAQTELEKLAFYDPLTQLPNRRFFRDHLDLSIVRAQKENKKIAMYMTDLDEFKKVNDTLGHDVGDKLLIDIALRLKDSLFEGDVVSRMGGDEFMILLDNIEDPTRLDHASNRVLEALRANAQFENQVIKVSGSIGIAIYPTDAKTPEELLRYADMALYNAKESGGDRVSYYSQELDKKIKEKVRIEQKLRQALDQNLLEIYIQPQYIAGTKKMHWGEILIRWFDQEEGNISPEFFIPLAEETGLIHELGDYVFGRVLNMLASNASILEAIGVHGVSVNLSAKQFFSPRFSEQIAEKFKQKGVEPSLVEFELTETTVMDNVDRAVVIMESLRRLGCQLSIDDFGTGYSSLAYLKRFPITSLKIDKSFIQDIPEDQNDIEISCAIIALAHSLGLSVVAEGVETEVQAKLLASYDCEYLQGYYFDRPMPIAELLERISSHNKIGGDC